MNPRTRAMLAALPARQLNLILVGLVLIAAMLAWSLGLRGALAEYRQLKLTLATLEAAGPGPNQPPAAPLPAAPAADAPATAPAPLALIAAVSHSAAQAGVTVSSAAQGPRLTVGPVAMHTIEIEANGSYEAIMAWLDGIETRQPAVGVIQLELQPDAAGTRRHLRLQLAIYDTGAMP